MKMLLAVLPLLLLLLLQAPLTNGTIIGTFVLPHGDFAYDPTLVDDRNGSLHVHRSAVRLGAAVAESEPDLVLLLTPHGVAAGGDFLVYENSAAAGHAIVGQDLQEGDDCDRCYTVDMRGVAMDANVSSSLVDEAESRGLNVSSLLSFADSEPQALGWGEILPLSFLNATLAKGGDDSRGQTRVVVVSAPSRRYSEPAVAMVHELMQLGALWHDVLEALDESVVVVASVDLAHTHLASGPYGYSAAAEPFDLAAGAWAATLEADFLLDTAANLADDALSCGFTGMVMVQGIIAAATATAAAAAAARADGEMKDGGNRGNRSSGGDVGNGGDGGWTPFLFADRHPTYYGMMVSAALPPQTATPPPPLARAAPSSSSSSSSSAAAAAAKTARSALRLATAVAAAAAASAADATDDGHDGAAAPLRLASKDDGEGVDALRERLRDMLATRSQRQQQRQQEQVEAVDGGGSDNPGSLSSSFSAMAGAAELRRQKQQQRQRQRGY